MDREFRKLSHEVEQQATQAVIVAAFGSASTSASAGTNPGSTLKV